MLLAYALFTVLRRDPTGTAGAFALVTGAAAYAYVFIVPAVGRMVFALLLREVAGSWLVNLVFVKELERVSGGATLTVGSDLAHEGRNVRAPVSKDRAKALRNVLLKNATGLRKP